jgi:hypothetical protein
MANFGYALSKGLEAGLNTGAGLIANSIKEDDRIAAEDRAANRQLATEERLLAIREAAKSRAYERFSSIMRTKQGEEVPQEPASVAETGLTAEGAQAAGLQDGIQGGAGEVGRLAKLAKDTLANPTATEAQKADARGLIEQLTQQGKAQAGANAQAVEGKTRKRTFDEVVDASREEAALTDPTAFVAGEGMFAADRKDKRDEQKLAAQERIKRAELEQKDRAEAGKDRRHADQMEAIYARIDASTKSGGDKTALIQNAEYLKTLGYSDDKIEKFIFEKKEIPLEDIAAKIMAADKLGEMTPQQAAQKAIALRDALNRASNPGPAPTPTQKPGAARPPLSSFAK